MPAETPEPHDHDRDDGPDLAEEQALHDAIRRHRGDAPELDETAADILRRRLIDGN